MAATKVPPLATQLRELLAKATKEDVDLIDVQIEEKEQELATLRADRKMLAQAAGIEEPVKRGGWPRGRKSQADDSGVTKMASDIPARRKKVLAYLRANGVKSLQALSEQTGIARQGPGNLASVLACEWFHTSPDGLVTLTDKGDRASTNL